MTAPDQTPEPCSAAMPHSAHTYPGPNACEASQDPRTCPGNLPPSVPVEGRPTATRELRELAGLLSAKRWDAYYVDAVLAAADLIDAEPAPPPVPEGDALAALDADLAERMDEAHVAMSAKPDDDYAEGLFTAYQIARHFVTEQQVALAARPASPAPTGERPQPDAFDLAHDDVLTAWRVRNAALAVAASFVHPGPDGEDEAARRRLVREWVEEGHDAVEDHDRQFQRSVVRMVEAEREVERLTALLDARSAHPVRPDGAAGIIEALIAAVPTYTTGEGDTLHTVELDVVKTARAWLAAQPEGAS